MVTPDEILTQHTRRVFLERSTLGLGAMAATSLLDAALQTSARDNVTLTVVSLE